MTVAVMSTMCIVACGIWMAWITMTLVCVGTVNESFPPRNQGSILEVLELTIQRKSVPAVREAHPPSTFDRSVFNPPHTVVWPIYDLKIEVL